MILLQSQPFGRRDPWAVVNHAAAASALRAVRTVLHQLIRLSASGSRPVKDLSRRSRGESCQLGTGQRGRRVTGVELPRQRYTACGELPNLNLVGHFQDPGVTKKGHQRVCDQHAGGPGCAENRGGSGAPFVVPCRLSGGIASAGLRHTRSLGVRAMPPRKIYGSEGSDTSLRGVTDT